ncbi:hypothetical protein SKAU_G00100370, partial [Synaphobranchus kaupii]
MAGWRFTHGQTGRKSRDLEKMRHVLVTVVAPGKNDQSSLSSWTPLESAHINCPRQHDRAQQRGSHLQPERTPSPDQTNKGSYIKRYT